MQEFIQMVTKNLGVSEAKAKSATGGLLQLIKDKADTNDFTTLLSKLPGASELLAKAPQTAGATAGAGGLGGIVGKAASAIGGKLGSGLELAGMFKQTGIDSGQIGTFVGMFLDFVKSKAGASLVQKLLGKVPELAKLVS